MTGPHATPVPRGQVDGIVLLDKPRGLSSNQALQKVRRLFNAAKAGHTGALDPLATGALPVCLGEATKVAGILLGNDKAYTVGARLGITTDTDDSDGQPLRERPVPTFDSNTISALLPRFVGSIRQVPPVYSALKQGGEPLYRKARRGETIEVPARTVSIHAIDLLATGGDSFELHVVCGSGTYIRSLVRDLGELLGCGAHVTSLRRLWVAPFRDQPLWSLEALQALAADGGAGLDSALMPIGRALQTLPCVVLDAGQARRLGMGQPVQVTMPASDQPIQVCDAQGQPLGLAQIASDGHLQVQRLFRWAAFN